MTLDIGFIMNGIILFACVLLLVATISLTAKT